jgi:t-SNARE complex subunit (syntaxin)
MKSNQTKVDSIDFSESNNLLDEGDSEEQQFKVKDIKYYEDIANYRNAKLENIREQTFYVGKISKDIHLMTQDQHKKVEKLDDNLDNVLHNAKETFNSLLKTSKEERNFRDNKCCVILLISLALFFLILIMLNMNR